MSRFVIHNCEQRSEAWHALRAGRLTGSRAADMVSTIKGGEAAARRDLRLQLVCERLTGKPQGSTYTSADMMRGIQMEPAALAAYEAMTGDFVTTSGFLALPELMAGCSLDGHLGDYETLVSIKCPKTATHIGYLRAGVMPASYVPQMLHELWITGAREYHFLSFDDRLPDALRTFFVRVPRNEDAVQEYADKAKVFLAEVDRETEALRTLADLPGALKEAV